MLWLMLFDALIRALIASLIQSYRCSDRSVALIGALL